MTLLMLINILWWKHSLINTRPDLELTSDYYFKKGSFYATDLECILQAQKIKTIIVCGVTTEVCVHTTVREANDRGYYCIVVSDATASYNDTFHTIALDMIAAQNGIFGSVTSSQNIIDAMEKYLSE